MQEIPDSPAMLAWSAELRHGLRLKLHELQSLIPSQRLFQSELTRRESPDAEHIVWVNRAPIKIDGCYPGSMPQEAALEAAKNAAIESLEAWAIELRKSRQELCDACHGLFLGMLGD